MLKDKSYLGVAIYTALFFAMAFWGLSFVWLKIVFEVLGPFSVVFLRLFISFVFLSVLVPSLFRRITRMPRKDIAFIALMAFFEPFAYFLAESFGLQLVSATIASLIVGTIPVATILVAPFLFKEQPGIRSFVLSFYSLLGVVVFQMSPIEQESSSWLGIFLMFLAVFSSVGHVSIARNMVRKYSPVKIVFLQNFFGSIYFLPLFLFFEWNKFELSLIQGNVLWALLALSLLASCLSFILLNFSMRYLGAVKTNLFTNFIPIFTAIGAYFILNESFDIQKIIGMCIILSGVIGAQFIRVKSR